MNDLINSINDLEEVKKFKRLEKIVHDNPNNHEKLKKLYSYQKQMINSKHYDLENNYYIYLEKYNVLKKELEEDVTLDLYLNSLTDVTNILEEITEIIKCRVDQSLEE